MAVLVGVAAVAAMLALGATPSNAIVPGPNGQIAFESSRTGDNEIFTMNPDGSAPTNITNNPANDVFPAWSPDGTRITFASDRAEAGNLDVYVMNADGSGVTQLTNSPGEDRGTSWTSDGQRIVFHSARDMVSPHPFDIFTMNADGSNETMIFSNGSAAYVCGNSATGVIVFNSNGNPLGTNPANGINPNTGLPILDFEIFTMNMTGGNLVQVTNNTVLDSGPKWSPDCSTISYNSLDAGGSLDVHRINADGTGDVNLTNTPGVFDAFSAWSPDGTRIVFSSNRDVNFEIYTMSAVNGSNVARLTFTGTGEADLRADWGTRASAVPTCTQNLTGDVVGPFTVNAGQMLCISNARVVGPITVNAGGSLSVTGSQITNGIVATSPAFFSVCGSQISGPSSTPGRGVVVTNSAVPLRIGDPATGCAMNRVAGDITLTGNTGGLTLGANAVSGNVTVNNNTGSVVIKANTVFKALACSGNNPAPVNAGQPNTASVKSGQCSAL